MRVRCANCGMIYDINLTPMDFRSEAEMKACAVCPKCKSNAKDDIETSPKWTKKYWAGG